MSDVTLDYSSKSKDVSFTEQAADAWNYSIRRLDARRYPDPLIDSERSRELFEKHFSTYRERYSMERHLALQIKESLPRIDYDAGKSNFHEYLINIILEHSNEGADFPAKYEYGEGIVDWTFSEAKKIRWETETHFDRDIVPTFISSRPLEGHVVIEDIEYVAPQEKSTSAVIARPAWKTRGVFYAIFENELPVFDGEERERITVKGTFRVWDLGGYRIGTVLVH